MEYEINKSRLDRLFKALLAIAWIFTMFGLLSACKEHSGAPGSPSAAPSEAPASAAQDSPPAPVAQARSILDMSLEVDGQQSLCGLDYHFIYKDPTNVPGNPQNDKFCIQGVHFQGNGGGISTICVSFKNSMPLWGSWINPPISFAQSNQFIAVTATADPQDQPRNCNFSIDGYWRMSSWL